MRVLVTGGAGFIGRRVVEELASRGADVRILDSLHPAVHGPKPKWPAGIKGVQGDVRSPSDLRSALRGVTAVLHLAALVGVGESQRSPGPFCDINLGGTGSLLEAVGFMSRRPARLVVAGSMSSYGEGAYSCPEHQGTVRPRPRDARHVAAFGFEHVCGACGGALERVPLRETDEFRPESVYAVTKASQEALVMTWGRARQVETVSLRFFNVLGAGQALSNPYTGVGAIFAACLKEGRSPPVCEDGLQTRDFVPVEYVAYACAAALEKEGVAGHAFNVGSGRPTTLLNLAHSLAIEMDREIPATVLRAMRLGDIRHAVANVSKSRRMLGLPECPPIEKAIAELASWSMTVDSKSLVQGAFARLEAAGLMVRPKD